MLNYNQTRTLAESVLTFTHELGHSFGAKHDSDTEDEDCMHKGYIMSDVFEDSVTQSGERTQPSISVEKRCNIGKKCFVFGKVKLYFKK